MVGPDVAGALGNVINLILGIVKVLVFASIITSWVGDPSNSIVQTINSMVEPIYRPIRKITSRIPGPLDWAPIGVLIVIIVIEYLVVNPLLRMAATGSGPMMMP